MPRRRSEEVGDARPERKTHLQRASGLSRIARAQCSIAIALAYACAIPLYPYAIAKFGLIEGALAEEERVLAQGD